MNLYKNLCGLVGLSLIFSFSFAQEDETWTSNRADGHAPIGLMGDHMHGKGELMFSYRYMRMNMDGMRSGTDALDIAEVLNPEQGNFLISPTRMPMDMHMLGIMYAVSDQITLMGMVNYLSLAMDHETRAGGNFTTESAGLGDLRLSALVKLFDKNRQRIHANIGLSIPTGSIDQMDVTPASAPNEMQLPYPMQLGSGSFDLLPGLTYLAQAKRASLGAQLLGTIRLGENARNYRLGNQLDLNLWAAYSLAQSFSTSFRLNANMSEEISGSDETYMMMVNNRMVPTVFPENFGGTQLNAALGANYYFYSGGLKNVRIAAEVGLPVYQDLNGFQMDRYLVFTLGIQYAL